MALFNLENKTAIITGGASGIGEAISKKFAAQGAYVHILEFNAENGNTVVSEITANGGKAVFHHCDVSNNRQVAQLVASIGEKQYIDILVNNAGIAHVGTLEGTAERDMDRIYNVNIKGVYNCMHAVIGKFKE